VKIIFPRSSVIARKARETTGFSQERMSRALGYKNGQFTSNCERGLSCYPPKKWNQIIELGKVEREELITAYLSDKEEWLRGVMGER